MKISNLASRRIILFGQQILQNSIIIGYIHQRTGINCQLIDSFNGYKKKADQFDGQTLILIDADSAPFDELQCLLENISESEQNTHVAFFNVQQASTVESLVIWPMVNGFFYKENSQQLLVKGIAGIFNGELWLPRRLMAQYIEHHRRKPHKITACEKLLTRREKEILSLTSTGATNTEIAEQLNVSMHTVKTHIYNLFKKIDVSNRIQAVNWAKDNLESLQESII